MNKCTTLTTRDEQIRQTITTAHNDYEKVLRRRAEFKIQNYSISEDLVQTTFLKTWKYLVAGGKIETMKNFLYHILNGLIIDEYRKNKAVSLETLLGQDFNPGFDDSEHLMNIIDGRSAALLIAKLPKKYREVIYMKYIENLSPSEISNITKQAKNTVSVQAHRGLIELKTLYNQQKCLK